MEPVKSICTKAANIQKKKVQVFFNNKLNDSTCCDSSLHIMISV